MHKLIQNLRQKPEKERRQILHITTIMFAVLFAVLWVYSLGKHVSDEEISKKVEADLAPFSKLTDDLGQSFNTLIPEDNNKEESNSDLIQ